MAKAAARPLPQAAVVLRSAPEAPDGDAQHAVLNAHLDGRAILVNVGGRLSTANLAGPRSEQRHVAVA
jgi:hypothetical protein